MSMIFNCFDKQVKAFCAQIGADPLLVQGAGGNVSWKDGNVMWVKASGMWLAEAESKEIFVPVSHIHLQHGLANKDFSSKPDVNLNPGLRPSIETLLHALMPHKVVAHLHAVEILARLVQFNSRQIIKSLVADSVKWIYIDYFKPGADLARAVSEELNNRPDSDVVFMRNHGVVIGGRSVDEVLVTLHALTFKLKAQRSPFVPETSPLTRQSDFLARGYVPCVDKEIGLLALKDELINRLRHSWALYPDHVVFLGPKPAILETRSSGLDLYEIARYKPPFIFSCGDGVYESFEATDAQRSQLRCYYDVVSRLGSEEELSMLSDFQVSELLDWDAEKYRRFKDE